MNLNKLISIKRYYKKAKDKKAKDEKGMFLVMVAILLFVIIAFLALLVDIYILLQSQMDMKIAAQMMADGGLRYMTDEKTWLPDEDPPFDVSTVKSKMLKLAESSFIVGNRKKVNFKSSQVTMQTGKYKISTASFTPSALPADLPSRKLPPPGPPDDDYWAIKVQIATDTDSQVAALFAKILNQTKTDVSTYGIAYLSTSSSSGVSGYGFEN